MAKVRQDLAPGSPKGQKIRKLIRDHMDMSHKAISQNFPVWDELEKQYRMYRPKDDDDRESLDKHGVKKIIVPIQYATIQSMLTFMMEVFTAMKPVLRVRGADPGSVRKARVMEAALDYDYRGNRGYLMLQQWFFNAFRYEYGIIENTWGRKEVLKKTIKAGPSSYIELPDGRFEVPGALEVTKDWFVTFEGNMWSIVDNRQWFPDPRVPLTRFQEGAFCGRRSPVHMNDLLKMEDDGLLFNVKYVGNKSFGSTREADLPGGDNQRSRISSYSFQAEFAEAKKMKMHIDEMMIIEIIPRELELGDEDMPEQWLFNLVDGDVITRAEPSPFYKYPWEIVECNPDILAFMSQGIMEMTKPLADHLTFLFNSHMANVRKAVNDQLLVDPSRIDIRDILDPNAGSIIRLLPSAYGTDPANAIKQLAIVDITKGHLQDSQAIMELWERIHAVSSAMFGQTEPGRRTALEVQGVFRSSGSRMKMMADLFSAEGVAPLTEQMAELRKTNMSMTQFLEVAGRTAADMGVAPSEIVEGWLAAKKNHLDGVFSYPSEEGVLPQDRAGAADVMEGLLDKIAKAPFLAQIFDPVGIVREITRQRGVHNIDDFMNSSVSGQVSIFSPEMIQQYVASLQLQPIPIGGNRPQGRPNEGVREDAGTLGMEGLMNGAGRPRDY